jgi:hypothetical protein
MNITIGWFVKNDIVYQMVNLMTETVRVVGRLKKGV